MDCYHAIHLLGVLPGWYLFMTDFSSHFWQSVVDLSTFLNCFSSQIRFHYLASCHQTLQILSTGWEWSWLPTEVFNFIFWIYLCFIFAQTNPWRKEENTDSRVVIRHVRSQRSSVVEHLVTLLIGAAFVVIAVGDNGGWLCPNPLSHFVLQVLWWSWVSHPLSPQASSCSCWLVPRSLRLATPPKTEPSSMEPKNVGIKFKQNKSLHTDVFNFGFNINHKDLYYLIYVIFRMLPLMNHMFLLQCLEWSSPLGRQLCTSWLACMETPLRWVLGFACLSLFR